MYSMHGILNTKCIYGMLMYIRYVVLPPSSSKQTIKVRGAADIDYFSVFAEDKDGNQGRVCEALRDQVIGCLEVLIGC